MQLIAGEHAEPAIAERDRWSERCHLPLGSMNFFERVIHTHNYKIDCFLHSVLLPFDPAFDQSSTLLTLFNET